MNGNNKEFYECHLQDYFRYKVEKGKCMKSNGIEVKVLFNVGKVDNRAKCQSLCDHFGGLCKGFDF